MMGRKSHLQDGWKPQAALWGQALPTVRLVSAKSHLFALESYRQLFVWWMKIKQTCAKNNNPRVVLLPLGLAATTSTSTNGGRHCKQSWMLNILWAKSHSPAVNSRLGLTNKAVEESWPESKWSHYLKLHHLDPTPNQSKPTQDFKALQTVHLDLWHYHSTSY